MASEEEWEGSEGEREGVGKHLIPAFYKMHYAILVMVLHESELGGMSREGSGLDAQQFQIRFHLYLPAQYGFPRCVRFIVVCDIERLKEG